MSGRDAEKQSVKRRGDGVTVATSHNSIALQCSLLSRTVQKRTCGVSEVGEAVVERQGREEAEREAQEGRCDRRHKECMSSKAFPT